MHDQCIILSFFFFATVYFAIAYMSNFQSETESIHLLVYFFIDKILYQHMFIWRGTIMDLETIVKMERGIFIFLLFLTGKFY